MKLKILCAAFIPLVLSGCAINQVVKPVEQFEGKEICIIQNNAVKLGFLDSYRLALLEKGYMVKQLPSSATTSDCPITSTYTASWRWDLALYMAFADIQVYNNGKKSGQATYNAMSGSANMGKFIRGDAKIKELVDKLFPGGPKIIESEKEI